MYLPSFAMLKTALLVALVCGGGLGFAAAATFYKAAISKMETAQAEREAAAVAQALETQQARIDKIQGALDAAQKQTIQARADADAAAAANGRLRKSLADYRARHANTAASSGQGEPGSDPIGVLAELLEGLADRGAEVSRYADEVKIAGAACEAAR